MSSNRFYNCLTPDKQPAAWAPPEPPPGVHVLPDSVYFGGVFAAVDRLLPDAGLTFYLTHQADRLPSYGPDVVAFPIADELATLPPYLHRVRAVFKNLGTRPQLGCHPLLEPSLVNALSLAVYARNTAVWLPSAARHARAQLGVSLAGRARPAPVHEVPHGTFNQVDLPVKDIAERRSTLFFAGSLVHEGGGARDRVKARIAPKSLSRTAMLRAAEQLTTRDPRVTLDASVTGTFWESFHGDARRYSERLMDAQIALVPRGTVPWTGRYFQALRAGCVIVTDIHPSAWYTDGAPVIRIPTWDRLGEVVPPLLDDPARMRALHERALAWWHAAGSEEAVASYVVAALSAQG